MIPDKTERIIFTQSRLESEDWAALAQIRQEYSIFDMSTHKILFICIQIGTSVCICVL